MGGSSFPLVERLQIQGPLLPLLGRGDVKRVESITLTGVTLSVAGIPLQAQGRLFLRGGAGSVTQCDGWLSLQHPLLKGLVEISGPVTDPILLGWVEGVRSGRIYFVAQLEVAGNGVRLVRMDLPDGWSLSGTLGRNRAVLWVHPEDQIPQEMVLEWNRVSPSEMDLEATFLDDQISLRGRVGLKPPYPVDLVLDLKQAQIAELAPWILPAGKVPHLAGRIQGRVNLTGNVKQALSRGEILSGRGRFNREIFNGVSLRFQGVGPILQVQNSQLSKPEGILLMEGTVDLRRLGQQNFFSQIRLSPIEKAVHWDGWQVRSLANGKPGASGLQMQRKTAQDRVEVGLDYQIDSQAPTDSVQKEGVEMNYSLSSDERLNLRLDRDKEFVGLEHRRQF